MPNENAETPDENNNNNNTNEENNIDKQNESIENPNNNEKQSENVENSDNNEKTNENVEQPTNNEKAIDDYKNDTMKIEDGNLICVPEATIQNLKELFNDKQVTVINKENAEVKEGNLATGYVINIEDKSYNVVKLGDVNGDGLVKATDYMTIKNYIMNISKITLN